VILLGILCAAAAAYQATALLASIAHHRKHQGKRRQETSSLPGVSILKPVRGADARFFEAIRTHAQIDYPEFEILFGVGDPDDSAIPHIERLQTRYPDIPIRLSISSSDAPNAKVGKLEVLAREARYPVWVVNDGDIHVEPDYLRNLVAELQQPGVGLVTCLYRATADTLPASFESLGISTDFAPSTLVAPFVGVNEFGLGSTLAFRAADWNRAGGFAAIRSHLADDYQIGKRLSGLGLSVVMARMFVVTHLGASNWRSIWHHQVRWARTIRLSRGLYFGLPVTNATLWAMIALAAGRRWTAALLLTLRVSVALFAGIVILRDPIVKRYWWLVPPRDVFAFAVWVAGAFGTNVFWRGRRLRLDSEGRIQP
jgi:ceramide glucosyltransferase